MPVKLPTKTPDTTSDKPEKAETGPNSSGQNAFNPFRPEMPDIPGVERDPRRAGRGSHGLDVQKLLQIAGIAAAIVVIAAGVFWWVKSKPRVVSNSPAPDADVSDQSVTIPPFPEPVATVSEGPIVAATVDELSKPWAAKKFIFVKPLTQEKINAMVIRIPSGALWAFSLQGPIGRCELEYVTDLRKLASQYKFDAVHPMIVSPCDGTIYDPLKVGPLGGNTWARGEIVQGSSLRPPISIDVKVIGRSVLADKIE